MQEIQPVKPHNVDSLISEDMALKMGRELKPLPEEKASHVLRRTSDAESILDKKEEEPSKAATEEKPTVDKILEEDKAKETPKVEAKEEKQPETEAKESKEVKSEPTDEYGNPIEKPKLYTNDDVQRMIRERLQRAKLDAVEPAPVKEVKPQEGDETWQAELETFIDSHIEKKTRIQQQRDWQKAEIARQAEFEAKFQSGMEKYTDFQEVVANKNISDSMVLATRSLSDPAAFLYSAAKHHPQEIDRISKMNDPYAQAAEIGRLHERMVKAQNKITKAPTVLSTTTSDMPPATEKKKPSIDERIMEHAKSKRR